MDKETKISFIPKKPLAVDKARARRPMGIFLAVSFLLFFVVLSVYGGLYLYKANLEKTLAGKVSELEAEKEKGDPAGVIEKAETLQKRVESAERILGNHIALSRVFALLEELTLKSITFNSLTIKQAGASTGGEASSGALFSVDLKGNAKSYASLAYQSDVLRKEMESGGRVEYFSITGATPNKMGDVSFGMEMRLYAKFFSYGDVLSDAKETDGGVDMSPVEEIGSGSAPDGTQGESIKSIPFI